MPWINGGEYRYRRKIRLHKLRSEQIFQCVSTYLKYIYNNISCTVYNRILCRNEIRKKNSHHKILLKERDVARIISFSKVAAERLAFPLIWGNLTVFLLCLLRRYFYPKCTPTFPTAAELLQGNLLRRGNRDASSLFSPQTGCIIKARCLGVVSSDNTSGGKAGVIYGLINCVPARRDRIQPQSAGRTVCGEEGELSWDGARNGMIPDPGKSR